MSEFLNQCKTIKKWEWLAKTDFHFFSEGWCLKDLCLEREFQLTPKIPSSWQCWSSIFLRQILKISLGSSRFPVSISPPQCKYDISHLGVRGVWHQNIPCLQRQSRFKMPVNQFVERRFFHLENWYFPTDLDDLFVWLKYDSLTDFDDTTVFLLGFKMSIFLQTRCNWATLWIAAMVNRMLAIIARQWEQCHSSEEWKWKWEKLAAGVDLSKEKWVFWQIGLGRVGKGWEINLQNTKLGTLECGLQSWEIYSERISLLNS